MSNYKRKQQEKLYKATNKKNILPRKMITKKTKYQNNTEIHKIKIKVSKKVSK